MIEKILAWYDTCGRDLPWRRPGTTPWEVLLCEVMSQQTPVARVIPAWESWRRRWPTPADLAEASEADVLRAWDRLGYPRRALRLRECARVITMRHAGRVPSGMEELLALPGIGPYTAGAVRAFGFGKRALVLDTNIRRVLARLGGRALPPPSLTKAEEALARDLLPSDDARSARWNQAIMELGALVCTARTPTCGSCPVAAECRWREADYPADEHAGRRRSQAWEGTARQARGMIMAVLRERTSADVAELRGMLGDHPRTEEALDGLVADGLAVASGTRLYLAGSLIP
ncbi:MAG: A/G-specific adenine glycosylase [Flaviflexus sp.]|nr:A/G-specific adenine glycosylase [Flaviflexus sp.]